VIRLFNVIVYNPPTAYARGRKLSGEIASSLTFWLNHCCVTAFGTARLLPLLRLRDFAPLRYLPRPSVRRPRSMSIKLAELPADLFTMLLSP
jgi:hypothetical protein